MDVMDYVETIATKEDFTKFLKLFHNDFLKGGDHWQNTDLETYILGMEGYLLDYSEHSVVKVDFTPSWKLFATLMVVASVYE